MHYIYFRVHLCISIAGINTIIAVRGMMYYRRALKLQAFLDMASESGKMWMLTFYSNVQYLPVKNACFLFSLFV